MIIQHNIAALNAHRQLGINNGNTGKNLEKLSSGYRINRAGDDAAGLAISEKMRGQIRGLSQAEMNTSHAINLIQTAEGGLQETHAILQRMRELAVQSSNGTYDNDVDRANLDKEYQALMEEIDRIATSTHYNNINLLDGTMSAADASALSAGEVDTTTLDALYGAAYTGNSRDGLAFQIGANGTADQRMTTFINLMDSYNMGNMDTATHTTTNGITVTYYINDAAGNTVRDTSIARVDDNAGVIGANNAIDILDDAINYVSSVRADLGAAQNRLEHTMNNLGVTKENLTAAESTIRDVDMAKEMMEYTKNTILVQASQAMLAQAQTLPQGVLNLLR